MSYIDETSDETLSGTSEISILSDNFLEENELAVPTLNSNDDGNFLNPPILTPQVGPAFDQNCNKFFSGSKSIVPMEKLAVCRKFGGYPHENGSVFLQEFQSYATLHNILDSEPARKIAAFHLHLTGPAVTWFNSLSSAHKTSWRHFVTIFKVKYVNLDWNNPTVLMENEVFENLKLSPGQSLEDFHCQLVEKAELLSKPDYEVMCKFIKGLPEKLAFFVRAGSHTASSSALSAAKMGEACGYRIHDDITVSAVTKSTGTDITGAAKSEISELRDKVTHLTDIVEKLAVSQNSPTPRHAPTKRFVDSNRTTRENSSRQNTRLQYPNASDSNASFSCYKCQGKNHIQRNCLWNGQGQANASVQCQICFQFGHEALLCVKLGNIQYPRDIGHAPSGGRN